MKQNKLLLLAFFLVTTMGVFAQNGARYWQSTPTLKSRNAVIVKTNRNLTKPVFFELDIKSLKTALAGSPVRRGGINNSNTIVSFPDAEGNLQSYKVFESSNMDPALAAKYPEIKSYVGKGIEDPTALIYFSVSPLGLQTMLLRANKPVVLIEPYTTDRSTYAVYNKGDRTSFTKLECKTIDKAIDIKSLGSPTARPNADDGILRTFRIALSATGEYTDYFGGTVADGLAAINATLSRVNGIFEENFAVHFSLVANNNLLIYTNPATDPYSDVITNQEVQTNLTNTIGDANYDMGEAFGTQNQGGDAGCIGCVCVNPADAEGPDKAKGSGFTTLPDPTGDIFDIDFVSHEFGHTLGGNHTFTYQPTLEGTIAQVEPGSGTTILSYAGYTGATDILEHPYPYFHAVSIQQITDNIKTKTCSANTPTGNAIPAANAGPDYTIPKGTPFILTGTGTDADNATLLYNWEQMDVDIIDNTPYPNVNDASGPEFRNYDLSTNNSRTFPILATVLAGATSSTWEAVPNVARALHFRFTVRDNHAGGAANNSDDAVVTVSAASGPFVVTAPNTAITWAGGTSQTVTWNVAGTTASPVSCANVKISLSTDGGNTFPTVLLASTPNDGSQSITVPNTATTTARVKVEAVGNIFFDLSNTNFTITSAATTYTITVTPPTNGSISPGGAVSVASGANKTFTITPASGFVVQNVTVDGAPQGALTTYTFTNVTANHTIAATFIASSGCVKPVLSAVITNVKCNGDNTGTINLSVSGGTSPYIYAWRFPGPATATTQDISSLVAGNYYVVVTATGGCKDSARYVVSQPTVLKVSLVSKTNVSCKGGDDGSITVKATGGTAPYTYRIHTKTTFQSSGTFGGRIAKTYAITAMDKNGCTADISNIVIKDGTGNCAAAIPQITAAEEVTKHTAEERLLKADIFPNPGKAEFTLKVSGNSTAPVEIKVIDLYGRAVHQIKGSANQSYKFGQHFVPGAYMVEIFQGNNVKTLKVIKTN